MLLVTVAMGRSVYRGVLSLIQGMERSCCWNLFELWTEILHHGFKCAFRAEP